jgi:hypothetical protein
MKEVNSLNKGGVVKNRDSIKEAILVGFTLNNPQVLRWSQVDTKLSSCNLKIYSAVFCNGLGR